MGLVHCGIWLTGRGHLVYFHMSKPNMNISYQTVSVSILVWLCWESRDMKWSQYPPWKVLRKSNILYDSLLTIWQKLPKLVKYDYNNDFLQEPDNSAESPQPLALYIIVCLFPLRLAVQFVYFAVTLNMDTLFGDIYLNTMLAAITEIPSNIIVTICLQKFGRKRPLLVLFSLVALGGFVSMGLLIADSK